MKKKHSVPQNIMDVEFKLFGSLTIRQFSYVAATFIIGLVVYISSIPEIVKYLILSVVVPFGLALAFLKVNGMPFTSWIGNYINSMMTPQRKVYKSSSNQEILNPKIQAELDELEESAAKLKKVPVPKKSSKYLDIVAAQASKPKLNDSFRDETVSGEGEPRDILSDTRSQRLEQYFTRVQSSQLNDSVGTLDSDSIASMQNTNTKIPIGTGNQHIVSNVKDLVNTPPQTMEPVQTTEKLEAEQDMSFVQPDVASQQINIEQSVLAGQAGGSSQAINKPQLPGRLQPTNEFQSVNTTQLVGTAPSMDDSQSTGIQSTGVQPTDVQPTDASSNTITENNIEESITKQTLDINQPLTTSKIQANQISGFVLDSNSNPIVKAQIIVKESKSGNPVRVAYSDPKGRFFIPSQIENGEYTLEIRAKGYVFPEFKLSLIGEVIPVYRYQAK